MTTYDTARNAGAMHDQARIIKRLSHTLAKIRDAILPKLMSGELQVDKIST
jgi:hypothetical protein